VSVTDAPTFVLVHGGRHGGWAWRLVAARLRRQGHEVHTPTLTGLGERSHLLTPDVGLDTHIRDLVNLFEYEDLSDTILVCHSYGGMPVSGAMEELFPRVRRVVFVDAHMPRSGESVFDMNGHVRAQRMREMVEREGEGWFVPNSDASWWGLTDPDQIAWVNSKTSPQPFKSYTDSVGSTERIWGHPGTFIECSPSRVSAEELERVHERAAVDEQFHLRGIDTCHEAMLTEPDLLTELLIEASTE